MFCDVVTIGYDLSIVTTDKSIIVLDIPTGYYSELTYVQELPDEYAKEVIKRCLQKS